MIKKIDCRTLQCPQPVLKTKEALEQQAVAELSVVVDNDAAVENVSRFLNFQGFEVSVDSDGISSTVSGKRDAEKIKPLETTNSQPAPKDKEYQKILIIISSEHIGKGDDDLGGKLMINFVKTLKEMGSDLWRLVFLNHGVKLCTDKSKVLEEIQTLEESGVDVLVCGACLTHLELMDKKKAGQTTNMLDVITSMQIADKVINL